MWARIALTRFVVCARVFIAVCDPRGKRALVCGYVSVGKDCALVLFGLVFVFIAVRDPTDSGVKFVGPCTQVQGRGQLLDSWFHN